MKANLGLLLGGLLWPLALVAGLLMTLLLLGLLFGWPLMWATISAEGTDSFDALSRSYAYVFQRPLHYLFYIMVAAVIGWLGWLLVRELRRGRDLDGLLGRRLGKRQRTRSTPSWAAAPISAASATPAPG